MTFHSQLFLESQSKFHGSSHHQPVVVDGDGTTVLGDVTLWKMGHLWMKLLKLSCEKWLFSMAQID